MMCSNPGFAVILTSGSGFTAAGRRGRRASRGCTERNGRRRMTLGELVEKLGGKLVQGSRALEVDGVSSYAQADPSTLCSPITRPPATEAFASTAGAVVLRPGSAARLPARQVRCRSRRNRASGSPEPQSCCAMPSSRHRASIHGRICPNCDTSVRASRSVAMVVVGEDVSHRRREHALKPAQSSAKRSVSAAIATSTHARCSIPEPRSAIASLFTPAPCWVLTASAMCAIPPPAPTPNSRSRARW